MNQASGTDCLYIVMETDGVSLLVTTTSSFFKPSLAGLTTEDGIQLLDNWIKTERIIGYRYTLNIYLQFPSCIKI